jgi:hypothetical protein
MTAIRPSTTPRTSRAPRRAAAAGWLALAAHAAGACYSYTPVGAPPDTNPVVQLELTDQERANLRGAIGEYPLRVEGRLAAFTDTTYTLNVASVESVRGEPARWAGEPFTFRRSGVSVMRVKRLDRTRTLLTVGGSVAALGTFIATRSLLGLGGANRDPGDVRPPSGPGPVQ